MEPRIIHAIQALVPDAEVSIKDNDINKITWLDSRTKPSKEAIQAKLKELEKLYADNGYQRKRLEEYNAIGLGEQLDMIYHDMDGWKKQIKSVKDKYPKP